MQELIPLALNKIMQSRVYTAIILATEHKKFAIYTEPQVGSIIQSQLAKHPPLRPSTFDLFNEVLKGFNIQIIQVVITDVKDTIYYSKIFLEQRVGDQKCILEVDARPSDCITLALFHKIPVFCKHEVLEKTIGIQE